jgi:hypothetical protein
LEFVGAPRREDCTRFEARRSGDREGAFLVNTCFLVMQGSSTLSEHLSPNELRLILEEYNDVIKKYKSKFKSLESDHIKLKASHDELLVRHNEVVETHESCGV